MASIKVKFRPSQLPNHEGTIYYQIIHERKPRQLLTEYHVFPSEWDENRSMVITTQKSERKSFILSIRERIRWDIERLTKIIRKLENKSLPYMADDVIDEFNRYANEYSLFNYMESMIAKLKQNGKIRTSETYSAALNSFKKFRNDEDIMLDCINTEVMEAYEAWHQNRGNIPNTISFYTRILRAVYHRAVEDDIIENRNPFRHVYTGVDKTVKRALPLQTLKKIKSLDLSLNPTLDYARDMFMMSFMLRGMSFIDMAYLRKTDLTNGHIIYRRRKTGQQLTIAWTTEMQVIIDKYPENTSEYLLPIIRNSGINERCAYRNVGYLINRNLKKVAEMTDIQIPLTMYVARHSWASAAKAKGIPLSVISEGMGHDSEATTQIYLASLDTSVVDKANSLILKSL
ncbi:site-specific integrase [Lepagella muris]|uniref:Site-specific integrase n=1 Tax=Lepagella muris TaxID=3032870 RepID=A0AC61REF6_9BACT|nr:site-specific integrase [Lepagella muris]ROT03411.1 site-specific integrase [Muribaculaceae bacterium Isolate-037 (Harlan)]TGY77498.1 site-specific integrase [Lepagella muris]THG50100.1 site-specific integrase [Bacteroidales bacterium]TKC60438.1 site-specific integrase [Bacteroidales bacterium]